MTGDNPAGAAKLRGAKREQELANQGEKFASGGSNVLKLKEV
jgi:hypothetical protein